MNKGRIKTLLLIALAAVITVMYVRNRDRDSTCAEAGETEIRSAKETEPETETSALIYVYICGHVKKPDMYALPEGSRLYDIIKLAGGLTEDADRNIINPAQRLKDGERVYIPATGEADPFTGEKDGGKLDLNSASAEQLTQLPGIGEKKAEIIYRFVAENGPLTDIAQLMDIPGIKEGVFSKIKDLITVN